METPPEIYFPPLFCRYIIRSRATRYIGYEGIIHIREGDTVNTMISLEPYLQIKIQQKDGTFYKEYPMEFAAASLRKGMQEEASRGIVEVLGELHNRFDHNIKFSDKTLNVKYADYLVSKKGRAEMGILTLDLTLNGETKTVRLPGKRGQTVFLKLKISEIQL